ncbi:MAG: DNA-processing protein DprA [Candidatus Dormibacteria bacterium]
MSHAGVVHRGSPGWPARLEHLGNPPSRLWVRGRLPAAAAPAVAVVGSRRPTPAGLITAREIAAEIAGAGIVVISGMARGVDSAAHQGALGAGGVTVAVLGCGIDLCYPPENAALRERIAATGAVISEDAGNQEPMPWRFPRRNRLIAALSEAVVVVEAAEKSGALSTARQAADLGREVLAVPGSIRVASARGTNLLIRDGARPYLGLADLLEAAPELRRGLVAEASATSGVTAGAPPPDSDPVLAGVLAALAGEPVHPDDLAAALHLTSSQVSLAITTLRLRGAVTEVCGGRAARTF